MPKSPALKLKSRDRYKTNITSPTVEVRSWKATHAEQSKQSAQDEPTDSQLSMTKEQGQEQRAWPCTKKLNTS